MKKFGVCELSVIPVRKSPVSKSEMVTQLLYGEIFTIINFEEKWSEICNTHDNYTGWVNNTQIRFIERSTYNSLKKNEVIYSLDINGSVTNKKGVKFSIPLGSVVSSCLLLNTIFHGKKGILTKSLTKPGKYTLSNLCITSSYRYGIFSLIFKTMELIIESEVIVDFLKYLIDWLETFNFSSSISVTLFSIEKSKGDNNVSYFHGFPSSNSYWNFEFLGIK